MNKMVRRGVDISVAFYVLSKNKVISAQQVQNIGDIALNSKDGQTGVTITEKVTSRIFGGILIIVRLFAKSVYRMLIPIILPFAFRAREYLLAGINKELPPDVLIAMAGMQREFHQKFEAALRLAEVGDRSFEIAVLERQLEMLRRLERIEGYSMSASRRVAINCGVGEVLIRTEVGYVLCDASDHAVVAILVESGDLERGTRLLIEKVLKPGNVFVDVGANLGLHTIAAARAMQGVGKIIAFEPYEPTKQLLERTVWMNGFANMTEIHQAAVSNISGHQNLFLGNTSGHHSLFPLDTTIELSSTSTDVNLVRLDDIIPAGQRVDLLKIDAEGAEIDALAGGLSMIIGNPDIALIVEFGLSHLKRTDITAKQWIENFAKLELYYRVINPLTGLLEDWTVSQLEQIDSVNLFFARRDSPAWARAEA